MGQTLERAEKFLSLVSLLAALLSAVAVALAARRFAQSHLDDCAMLRVLGLSQRTMAAAYTLEFVAVGALAAVLGVALGYGVHHAFVVLCWQGLVDSALPLPGWQPVALGVGMAHDFVVGLWFASGIAAGTGSCLARHPARCGPTAPGLSWAY